MDGEISAYSITMASKIPDASKLFREYFRRWYEEDAILRRPYPGLFPDVVTLGTARVRDDGVMSVLDSADVRRALTYIARYQRQAVTDFSEFCGVPMSFAVPTLERLDECFGNDLVAGVISRSDPLRDDNEFALLCCELGAFAGEVLLHETPAACWLVDWPVWDSCIIHPDIGRAAPVFHWAVKRLSNEAEPIAAKAAMFMTL